MSAHVAMVAPAKLTVSLRIAGRRPDGYHDLDAEMVSLDLHDVVEIVADADGVEVIGAPGARADRVGGPPDNIVTKALRAVGRRAAVRVRKRIPVGGGLGGGSTDAAAVLRWAGVDDLALAATLGADVPFCVHGGRARVSGLGERVARLPHVERAFVLLVPPFPVDTGAVYREWDRLEAGARARVPVPSWVDPERSNTLTAAALSTEPRLVGWARLLYESTGRTPVLAGSGSTWWVEGDPAALGVDGRDVLVTGRDEGRLIPCRAVPARWTGPDEQGPAPPQDELSE